MQPITATTWGLCSPPSLRANLEFFMDSGQEFFLSWEFLQISISLTLISGSAPLCVPGESAASANAVSPSTAAVNLRCPPSHPSPSSQPVPQFSNFMRNAMQLLDSLYMLLLHSVKCNRPQCGFTFLMSIRLQQMAAYFLEYTPDLISNMWNNISSRSRICEEELIFNFRCPA